MAATNGKPRRLDLTGRKFGRLLVVARIGKTDRGAIMWLCQCECGTEKQVMAGNLSGGKIVSCGCYALERMRAGLYMTHGKSGSKEYRVWTSMIARCKEVGGHKRYGGRGIRVCERWANSFETFFEDMGPMPSPEHSIDRFPDNDGNYEPGNCRWATAIEQCNNKSDNVFLDHEGQRLTVAQWAKIKGLSRQLIHLRLEHEWSIPESLDTPAGRLPSGVRKPREKYGPRPREKCGPRASTIRKMEAAKILLQEGSSYKEIAAAVEVSISSVYAWFGPSGGKRGRPLKTPLPEPEYVI